MTGADDTADEQAPRVPPLYKTTIVIWTADDPTGVELADLAQRATGDDAFCSKQDSVLVANPWADADPPSQEFFADSDWAEDDGALDALVAEIYGR